MLHLAARDGDARMAEYLLKCSKELDIETLTYSQLTAYQIAEEWNNTAISKMLEEYGCDTLPPPSDDDDDSEYSDDSDTSEH